MADTKTTGLGAITSLADDDLLMVVDVSDTTMAATGTNKKITKANAITGAASPLTTKGDVYGYSTEDARLAVGTNDQVLTADSTAATGLKWATPSGGGGAKLITSKQFEGVLPNGAYPFYTCTEGQTIGNVRWTSAGLPVGSNRTLDIRLNGTASTDSIFTSDTAISITTAQSATNGKYTTEGGTIDNGTLAENDVLYFVLEGGSTSKTWDDYIAIETA